MHGWIDRQIDRHLLLVSHISASFGDCVCKLGRRCDGVCVSGAALPVGVILHSRVYDGCRERKVTVSQKLGSDGRPQMSPC